MAVPDYLQLFLPFSFINVLAEINQELEINYYLLVMLIILTNNLETTWDKNFWRVLSI